MGADIVGAPELVHGKASPVHHDAQTVYASLPNPFPAGRYHSLVVDTDTLPEALEVSARTDQGDVMGLRHRELPVEGVQFHPESVLTPQGDRLLAAFLKLEAA